jgi:hypothetical protein
MRRREVAVRWGCLALMGSMLATAAQAQPPAAAEGAKLRAEVARLRAEVEMLQLDFDLARTDLIDDLKMAKGMAMMGGLISSLHIINGPPNQAPAGDAKAREAESKKEQEDAKKTEAEVAAYVAERKKELARLAAALASKRLDLEDAERRHRETGPAKPGDRAVRGHIERPDQAVNAPASRVETGPPRADVERVPILDPIPGNSTASCCPDPPSEAQVWAKVPGFQGLQTPYDEVQRNNVRFTIEKTGERADPCKVYPLAGPCQLVHCHYKATVSFDEALFAGGRSVTPPKARTEVVQIDKDHLRRCVDESHAHAAKPDAPDDGRASLTIPAPAVEADLERRMTRMEEKLDRILKALDLPGRED